MAVFRFSVFELDQATGELTRQGRRVHLAAQPAKALSILIERAGTVVTRDDLRRELWGEHTFVDFDRGLNFCVASVRRALGDEARRPRFVETLPKRGYRFIAEVRRIDMTPAVRRPIRWPWAAVLACLIFQGPALDPSAHTRETTTPSALAAFDRGLSAADDDAGLRRSVAEFTQATREDARFAEAHYALAETYLRQLERRESADLRLLDRARASALRAVRLEDQPATRLLLGTIRLTHDWDWDGARREFAQAVALAPQSDVALARYARFLSASGDDRSAIEAAGRLESISRSCELSFLESAIVRYHAREYADALDRLDAAERLGAPRGRTLDDWRKELRTLAVFIHAQQGDWPAARRAAKDVLALERGDRGIAAANTHSAEAAVRDFLGGRADRVLAAAIAGRASPVWMARFLSAAGRHEEALAWLRRATLERDPELVFQFRDPALDPLRRAPEFEAISSTIARRGTRL